MAKRSADDAELDKKAQKELRKKEKKEKKDKKDKEDKKDKKAGKDKSKKDKKKSKDTTSQSPAPTTPAIEAPSKEQIDKFLADEAIGVELGEGIKECLPVLSMASVPVSEKIQSVLSQYPKPTPIQSVTWPYLLQGNDVVGVAETGSGKTMAFGVPVAQMITANALSGVRGLIVSPTRELAMQIGENLALLTAAGVNCTCVYGGVPKYEQQKAVKKANIVVGTPGRLKDLISDGSLQLHQVQYLVLDEAARMLEKGFEDDIRQIISSIDSPDRQTVMFTATWPVEVRELGASFMKPAIVKVSVGDADELSANKRIKQIVEVVDPRQKEYRFLDILAKYSREDPKQKILIFALYKKEAARVERLLKSKGYHVAAVHGDLNQSQRTQALDDFKTGKCNLMLATDVAARGLDIPAVKVVINLTFPLTAEDYVHRIGRTGRAGQTGIAHTLFTQEEKHLSGALVNVLNGAGQPVPEELMKFGTTVKKKEHSAYGAFFKNVDMSKKAKKIKFD